MFQSKVSRRLFEEKDEVEKFFFLFCFCFFFLMGMDLEMEMEGERDWRRGKILRKKKDDVWIQYSSIEITPKVERPLINWVDGREEKVCAFFFTRNDLFGLSYFSIICSRFFLLKR